MSPVISHRSFKTLEDGQESIYTSVRRFTEKLIGLLCSSHEGVDLSHP